MPRGGQNAKPPELHILNGNPGKRPLPEPIKNERLDPATPPPAHLNAEAARHWTITLERTPWIQVTDYDRLAQYCEAWVVYLFACKAARIFRFGSVAAFKGWEPKDILKAITVLPRQRRDAEQAVRALGQDLGLDPVSRSRIRYQAPDEGDTFDEWEQGRKSG